MKKSDKIPFAFFFLAMAGAMMSFQEEQSYTQDLFFYYVQWGSIIGIVICALILLKQGLSEKK
jgi:hypothetical protein